MRAPALDYLTQALGMLRTTDLLEHLTGSKGPYSPQQSQQECGVAILGIRPLPTSLSWHD